MQVLFTGVSSKNGISFFISFFQSFLGIIAGAGGIGMAGAAGQVDIPALKGWAIFKCPFKGANDTNPPFQRRGGRAFLSVIAESLSSVGELIIHHLKKFFSVKSKSSLKSAIPKIREIRALSWFRNSKTRQEKSLGAACGRFIRLAGKDHPKERGDRNAKHELLRSMRENGRKGYDDDGSGFAPSQRIYEADGKNFDGRCGAY
ncbi:MAG: hypothetical protein AB1656_17475 [Candidatus Omnitrophota bacterium]